MIKKSGWGLAALFCVAAIVLLILFQRANTESLAMDEDARALAPGMFTELADGLTHYDIAGPDSGQVVLLVHGFSVPYYIWDTTFTALADSAFRVIRYDIFGRGYSDRPNTLYNGALFERQIANLMEQLGIDGPLDLIGLSMGGAIVMRVAANRPDLVRKVVLVDPAFQAAPSPNYPKMIGSYLLSLSLIPGLAEGQLTDFLYPENYPTWADQYRVQMQYEGFRRAIISTIYEFGPEDHLSYFSAVQGTGLPVKLIWGVEDQTISISGAETVQNLLDVDFLSVEDAGHLPHIEQADVVNPAIIEFLRRTDESNDDD